MKPLRIRILIAGLMLTALGTGSWGIVTECVSVDSTGARGAEFSGFPNASSDGRYVCFTSEAAFVPQDTNETYDVYVFDRQTGSARLVSTSSLGAPGNAPSVLGMISGSGRYVAFDSWSTNLVPGITAGTGQVYRKDLTSNTVMLVSASLSGEPDNVGQEPWESVLPSITTDGRYVAFSTFGSNLVPGDTNGVEDCFVKDCGNREIVRVSTKTGGGQVADGGYNPRISSDGSYVAFESYSRELAPTGTSGDWIFVKNMATNATRCVSVSSSGEIANGGCDVDGFYAFSTNARYVCFDSDADNLVPDDTNGVSDVFVFDQQTNTTIRVSTSMDGGEADGPSAFASFSPDGRFVSFASDAANLTPSDTNGSRDLFIKDLYFGDTRQLSVKTGWIQKDPCEEGEWDCIGCFDGRYAVWSSSAPGVVPGCQGGVSQVYFSDLRTFPVWQVKQEYDFWWMDIGGAVVTASLDGCFYLQTDGIACPGRVSGIRVEWPYGIAVGQRCVTGGYLYTSADGERYLDAYYVTPHTSNWTLGLSTLGLTNRSLGGGNWDYSPITGAGQVGVAGGFGLNNIGLLVRSGGFVTWIDNQTFMVDDGSGVGVRCECPWYVTVDPEMGGAIVNGISSCYFDGSEIKRRILVRSAADITPIYAAPPARPYFIIGLHNGPGPLESIQIIASWPPQATGMTLYRSDDCITWEDTGIPVWKGNEPSFVTGSAELTQSSNAYFRMTAYNPAGESEPSDVVYARPLEFEGPPAIPGISADSPFDGQTGVSQTPTFCWHKTWIQATDVMYYVVELDTTDFYWYPIWRVATLLTPPQTCVQYGQTQDVWVILPVGGPLGPLTTYQWDVLAIDNQNWGFAQSPITYFTTGDEGPPPPP